MKEAVTIPLDPAAYGDSFNRITLDYTADGPLQCIFRYTCDGEPVEDAFFLEEGSFAFSGLTESYMDRESAGVLSEITFVPLQAEEEEGETKKEREREEIREKLVPHLSVRF